MYKINRVNCFGGPLKVASLIGISISNQLGSLMNGVALTLTTSSHLRRYKM